ncbi:MAG: hypothetical protein A2636_01395 [Elusimicrobia bacterium RIFCSPHIGHO2_01_FULL_64_10]|nr:MAG: hypothetical protein A2636_01395 [Elusimicrobia bacterium RIFCSPHIGHO2_01_FULL_64_10]
MKTPSLAGFTLFTSIVTFFLIVAGALVTSTGSGLSVPDWPLSFGQWFPPMAGGVFYEHGHRVIAGFAGILIAFQSGWLWLKEERRWLCWLGTSALLCVVLQAVLGGLTVLYRLPPGISIAHGFLGQTVFCLTAAVAYFSRPAAPESPQKSWVHPRHPRQLRRLAIFAFLAAYFQLFLGAAYRHAGAERILHWHMANAAVVGLAVLLLSLKLVRQYWTRRDLSGLGLVLAVLFAAQVVLGLGSAFPSSLAGLGWIVRVGVVTAHVALGALLLAGTVLAVAKSFDEFERERTAGP